jgi:hypothetical protein
MLLLTDGSVIAHESDSPNWHRLTPNATGSYTNGTWTLLPPMPPNPVIPSGTGGPTYGPLFFGSAVLGDGTLLVAGGEYNTGVSPGADIAAATHFDPVWNHWTNVTTPAGWVHVGDVPLCVLADGRVLVGNIDSSQTAFFDPVTGTFSPGPNKGDSCSEESFTLLPDQTVLAVDCTAIPNAEKYLPTTNTWVPAGATPDILPQSCPGIVAEIGPTVLLADGRAFVIGATGDTALYTPPGNPANPGTWVAGPPLIDSASNRMFPIDAPAALMPNGKVLLCGSPSPPCSFPGPTEFFEFDPSTDTVAQVTAPSNAGNACFTGRMLLLPNGQVLFSNQSSTVTVYTPGGAPDPAWKPVISGVPANLALGHHYLLQGLQFNGLSQACSYGDDASMATNYPIARLEQGTKVFYCRTARHSTMAVATGPHPVDTILAIPPGVPPGAYNLVVVANGIPSDPVPVTLFAALPALDVDIEDGGRFDTVCGPKSLQLEIFNVGNQDLIVDQVFVVPGSGAFVVEPLPSFPVTLPPGAEIDVTITFLATLPGTPQTGTIRITSNDPNTPNFDVPVSAITGHGTLALAIADHGDFGQVCAGSLRDEPLTLANTGHCRLTVTNIASSTASFQPPEVLSYPLVIEPASAIELPIRFAPTAPGPAAAILTVFSDDPAGPKSLRLTGTAPAPRLTLIAADHADFGKVCRGSFADEPIVLNNSGGCALEIRNITSSSPEFLVPTVHAYPIRIGAGDSLPLPIRFRPTALGPATATLTFFSNDPAGPATLEVRGEAPAGAIRVTGSTCFGGVPAGTCAERVVTVSNVGECALHVHKLRFKRRSAHWKLIHSPFPATLRPGASLEVVIRYKATEECPHWQVLLIESDDPQHPVVERDLDAFTRREEDCRHEHKEGCGCSSHRPGCNCCDDDEGCREDDDRDAGDEDH